MNNAMSLKAKIRNIAREKNIPAQVVLQNYMFERFLLRLSKTLYKEKFIIKGGMLVSALVGLETRTTMDLDTTLKQLLLTPESIREAIDIISAVKLDDGISFECYSISPIRDDDVYGGYKVMMNGKFDTMTVPMSIDISTGDIITPEPVLLYMTQLFSDENIELYAYNVETILAEKLETVLRRGEFSTRPRDYYDIYILGTTKEINHEVLKKAIVSTSNHRGTFEQIADIGSIIPRLSNSVALTKMWDKYTTNFPYAKNISYQQVIDIIKYLLPMSWD